jgi:hypothetical protein
VRIFAGAERYEGAAYLGTRPTYDDGMPVLEVFLFDFDGDLYGRQIEVEFVDFIRADRKFATSEALVAQMQADCARAAHPGGCRRAHFNRSRQGITRLRARREGWDATPSYKCRSGCKQFMTLGPGLPAASAGMTVSACRLD